MTIFYIVAPLHIPCSTLDYLDPNTVCKCLPCVLICDLRILYNNTENAASDYTS